MLLELPIRRDGNTYTYDANGNQITRTIGADTFTLSYDAENRLTQVNKGSTVVAQFTYDGDGKRVKSVLDTETTLFIGVRCEIPNPGSGQTVSKYYTSTPLSAGFVGTAKRPSQL